MVLMTAPTHVLPFTTPIKPILMAILLVMPVILRVVNILSVHWQAMAHRVLAAMVETPPWRTLITLKA